MQQQDVIKKIRCTRCNRALKNPVVVDGQAYGKACAKKQFEGK